MQRQGRGPGVRGLRDPGGGAEEGGQGRSARGAEERTGIGRRRGAGVSERTPGDLHLFVCCVESRTVLTYCAAGCRRTGHSWVRFSARPSTLHLEVGHERMPMRCKRDLARVGRRGAHDSSSTHSLPIPSVNRASNVYVYTCGAWRSTSRRRVGAPCGMTLGCRRRRRTSAA